MTTTQHPRTHTDIAYRQWVGTACTLDGKPATIAGRACDFAIVATLDGTQRIEWAWITVNRIMQRDGAFRS